MGLFICVLRGCVCLCVRVSCVHEYLLGHENINPHKGRQIVTVLEAGNHRGGVRQQRSGVEFLAQGAKKTEGLVASYHHSIILMCKLLNYHFITDQRSSALCMCAEIQHLTKTKYKNVLYFFNYYFIPKQDYCSFKPPDRTQALRKPQKPIALR